MFKKNKTRDIILETRKLSDEKCIKEIKTESKVKYKPIDKKFAVALEGGGARGAYQAGAFKAIEEIGIEIVAVTGTSIGSINGAYYVQEKSAKALCDFWENIEPESLLPDSLSEHKKYLSHEDEVSPLNLLKETTKVILNGGVDLTNFKKSIYSYIDEEKVRNSDKKFGLVTFSITDRKPFEIMIDSIPKGELQGYILASAYLPIFKKEKIDGKFFIDGGIYDNLPINLLIKNNYRNVIAIEISKISNRQKVIDESANIIYVKPSEELGTILELNKEVICQNVKMGYFDTIRVLNNYYGKWFYLTDSITKKEAFDFFNSLDNELINSLSEILGVEKMPHKRMLFEQIIPRLAEFLGVSKEADYDDIIISLFDFSGKTLNLNRYKWRSFEQLILELKENLIFYNIHQSWKDYILNYIKTMGVYIDSSKKHSLIIFAKKIITEMEKQFVK